MEACSFVLDSIVTRFEASKIQIEDFQRLRVEATFNHIKVPITASRINVSEFKAGSGTEFTEEPVKLRETLEKCGLPVTVRYKGLVLGTGHISFPQTIIESIEEGMTDLIHMDTCRFQMNGEDQGALEILCRLVIKCEDNRKPVESDCRRNMDKSINPQDIMFLMSESQRCPSPCDPCLDTWEPEEGDIRLNLDLQRYKSLNATDLRPDETLIHNPVADAITCELKKMALECAQTINSINKRIGKTNLSNLPCGSSCHYPELKKDSCFSYLPPRKESNERCSPTSKPMPIRTTRSQLLQKKPTRFCPVCLSNMSWLPKFAACPKCGAKPMPVVEEPDKNEKHTVEEILKEYLGKPETINEYCDKDTKEKGCTDPISKCRCTCKSGKLCAHCRIRKLCADIFQPEEKRVSEVHVEELETYEEDCTVKKSQDSRPFLARVFSELRDVYDIKDTQRPPGFEQHCDKGTMLKRMSVLTKTKRKKIVEERRRLTAQKIADSGLAKIAKHKKPTTTSTIKTGHMFCRKQQCVVSRHHGWNWSTTKEARKYGWRPGAIRRPIKRLMNFFFEITPKENPFNWCKKQMVSEDRLKESDRYKPTLNVCKKNGEIFITLRSINNPNMEMKPIVFKIVKSDLAVALTEIKSKLKDMGFRKCICHKTLMMCTCRNFSEKKQLECELKKECKRRGMETCVDDLVLTDTSDSEAEFDFDVTPPAGVAKPLCPIKPRTISHSTQTAKEDRTVGPPYPLKPNPYWRAYDCAAGDRYTGTAFGAPGEEVFEDGVFGYRGGGPHGASATPGGRPKNKGIWGARPGGPMRGGGGLGPGGSLGGKNFPGAIRKPGNNEPIPVKMTNRFYKAIEDAAKAQQEAIEKQNQKKVKGVDMMKYLQKKGILGGKGGKGGKTGPVLGPDGLTDAQRRRRALRQMPVPPIETMPRLGRGFDPCVAQCYNPCAAQCCYPSGYYC